MTLTLRQLTLAHSATMILRDVSCTIPHGTLCVLIGPNGAGKSSLLKAIAGLLPPQSGTIAWENESLAPWTVHRKSTHMAYLPQMAHCHFPITVRQMVQFARHPFGDGASAAGENIVAEQLALMDLDALAERPVQTLSGGQWQRACLARVFAQTTPLVLLDEPTAHLDPRYLQRLFAHCTQLAQSGRTVICALHDLHHALQHADWIIALGEQQVRFAGPRKDMSDRAIAALFDLAVV